MKIAVLGAGSLGSAIGAALSEAGSEVWLVNRSAAHVAAIDARGLVVVAPEGEHVVRVRAAVDCSGIGPVDLVIVLVKSFHTREAMAGASSMLGPHTWVMSLQNGLGHEDILAEFVPRDRLLAGRTYVGGQLLGPGRVVSGTAGKQTVIGEFDGTRSARIMAVADEFNRAGLATVVSDNIVGAMWDKLLINVATGALSAITRLAYGPLYALPLLKPVGMAAVAEAMAVAGAAGVRLGITDPAVAWHTAGGGLPDDFKTSMLQSIEKGSITEVDFVNGAVVRQGLVLQVPTPVNATLLACVQGIERGLGL